MLVARTIRESAHSDGDDIRFRELSPDTLLLVLTGEVDAAAAPRLLDRITGSLNGYRQLVLDISRVGFFGTAGYALLQQLARHCDRTSIDWVAVTGPEVQRLLRACAPIGGDLSGLFPMATNVVSAVATLARGPHRVSLLPTH